ncbi:MAG: S41 family peptidase [Saprospiraceae bacterium]
MNSVNQNYNILQPLLLSVFLASGMFIGYRAQNHDEKLIEKYKVKSEESATKYDQVARLIENNYLFDADIPAITDEVFASMTSGLDPFSVYIPPSNYTETLEDLNANYVGLGITTYFYRDTLVVLDVIEGSPAQNGGLKPLDKIIRFNNNLLTKNNSGDLMKKIRNSKDKEIGFQVLNKNNQLKELKIKIGKIQAETIDKAVMLNDSTLYVSISQFSNHTYRELLEHIEKNIDKGESLGKLIIDVRGNPGGYLQEVLKILDQFFNVSDIKLVETLYKDGRRDVNKSTGRNFYDIDNIDIIVNSSSASGSEILAGVLQDLDRAVIVGQSTFGKGLVQDQFTLYNGGALRLTIAGNLPIVEISKRN